MLAHGTVPPARRDARCRPRARLRSVAALGLLLSATGCFRGGEREKEPPPGYAGGLCLAPTTTMPEPHCVDGSLCNVDRGFCYDPFDPCRGFFCGGSDRGQCTVDQDNLPMCMCLPGYSTERYELLCCLPTPGTDEVCDRNVAIEVDPTAGDSGAAGAPPPPDAG